MENTRARPQGQADGVRRFFGTERVESTRLESTRLESTPALPALPPPHLPPNLQAISKPFADMAARIVETIPYDPEREEGLRHLLEAKDCIVRAFMVTKG